MKIVAGLGTLDAFEKYVLAGADEVFCGCMPFPWVKKYGIVSPLNRREVLLYNTQVASLSDMRILKRLSEQTDVPVSVTVNSTGYAPSQYPEIMDFFRALSDMGLNRWIIADLSLWMEILRAGLPARVHVSGEMGEINTSALAFYASLGAARVIFHRKVSVSAMEALISAAPGLEYEAFILNEKCYYTGAYCNSLHCDEMGHLCRVPGKMGGIRDAVRPDEEFLEKTLRDVTGESGCGLCALPELQKAGVTHLKLVGRGARPEKMERDIRALKTALSLLGEEEFEEKMKRSLFPNGCGCACYYEGSEEGI